MSTNHYGSFKVQFYPISSFLAERNELAVIDAVYSKKGGVRFGFIDFYVAAYYSELINRKNLHIALIIPRGRVYGVLLGKDWDPKVVECLQHHSEDNRHVIHEVIPKHIQAYEVFIYWSTLGR